MIQPNSQILEPTSPYSEQESIGLQVLVVEDDAADAFLIRRALDNHPRVDEVIHAWDGEEALQLLGTGALTPDVAIIDLHMPRKNGFSLLIELGCREEPQFETVVFTSSRASSDAIRSKLRGANHFLTKPDTLEEMEAAIAGIISAM